MADTSDTRLSDVLHISQHSHSQSLGASAMDNERQRERERSLAVSSAPHGRQKESGVVSTYQRLPRAGPPYAMHRSLSAAQHAVETCDVTTAAGASNLGGGGGAVVGGGGGGGGGVGDGGGGRQEVEGCWRRGMGLD